MYEWAGLKPLVYTGSGQVYKRISKRRARRLFNKGKEVGLLPRKTGWENAWTSPMLVDKTALDHGGYSNFNDIVTEFAHYNCRTALGLYTSYYVKEG